MAPRSAGLSRHATHEGRGLCTPCYERANYRGRLADHPRRTWSRDDVMTEWDLLRRDGHTRAQAAERLGMTWAALDRAIWRARAAGDPRAVPGSPGVPEQRARTEAALARAQEAAETEPVLWSVAAPTMQRALEDSFGRSA
jgi:hypothetical protein